ncbi:Protein C13A2.9, partial [Aphelenchoides avenae]
MEPRNIRNNDENKYFVDFIKPLDSCNIITLGVGYDVTAEESFLGFYPKCRFTAVDPTSTRNREMVEKLNGTYVEGAIAGQTGVYNATVFDERRHASIRHIGLIDFMTHYNGDRVVDWLNIDVEGAELGILKEIH